MILPGGTITFLFTDIEGSTELWERHPEAMRLALARHDALVREAIVRHQGHVFKTVGDAFCAAFATAPDALQAALTAQCMLQQESWGEAGPLRVRMGLHTGVAEERDGDYFGPTLNRVARLQAVGHGQQTLLSQATYQLVYDNLPPDVMLADLGQHRLKDLLAPERAWQLCHPALPSEFPPLRSLDYLPTNLPHQMTSFIGREQEIAQVKRLLPTVSLLTLVGTGGAGKTRLALQVGAEVLECYRDGVWLVELAALTDPTLLVQTAAGALGLREEAGRPLQKTLQDYLGKRRLLLILDNCEHLIEACARLAHTLLTTCPGLTILATSREPFGIAGEHPWRVPSLVTPSTEELPKEEKDITTALMEYDACRLFVERAVLQRPDFVLTHSHVPAVVRLCRQLDGIPLALELAAARVRSLSVEEIDNRLDNRFRLLTGGSRTALPRHQTLRALIDWSYDLLNHQEKLLLGRVSVFAGGWTLEAAEQVAVGEGGKGESIEEWEVLDLLTSLADKSLVVVQTEAVSTRYRLLETVRQYARDRLTESGETLAIRMRHRDYFLKWAGEIAPKLHDREQAHWLDVLEQEHDNLRQVLSFCLEEERGAEEWLRVGARLALFWAIRGYYSEGRERLAGLLAHPGAQGPTQARAEALNSAGNLARMQGDYTLARSLYEESLTIHRENGNTQLAASALSNLGVVGRLQGDFTAARALFEESLNLSRELGDRPGSAVALNNLGIVVNLQGDPATARSLFEESLTIRRELGNSLGIADSLDSLGNAAIEQGDYLSARSLFDESLTIYRELGDRLGIANSLSSLGIVAKEQGDYLAARSLLQESLVRYREIGSRLGIVYSLGGFAFLALLEKREQVAARLWGARIALCEAIGYALPPQEEQNQERELAVIENALGQPAFQVALKEGRAMTMEQAMEYALEATEA